MKANKVFKAISMKHSIDVLAEIDYLSERCDYPTFKELVINTKLNKNTLRRITNRLSNVGLIKSTKCEDCTDKRERVFVVCDHTLNERLIKTWNYIHSAASR